MDTLMGTFKKIRITNSIKAMNPNMASPVSLSIHKPPASIRFALIKHALAVTVEPFKFSSRQIGVAYELSEYYFRDSISLIQASLTSPS